MFDAVFAHESKSDANETLHVATHRPKNFGRLASLDRAVLAPTDRARLWSPWASFPAAQDEAGAKLPSSPGIVEVRLAGDQSLAFYAATSRLDEYISAVARSTVWSRPALGSARRRTAIANPGQLEFRTIPCRSVEEAQFATAHFDARSYRWM